MQQAAVLESAHSLRKALFISAQQYQVNGSDIPNPSCAVIDNNNNNINNNNNNDDNHNNDDNNNRTNVPFSLLKLFQQKKIEGISSKIAFF